MSAHAPPTDELLTDPYALAVDAQGRPLLPAPAGPGPRLESVARSRLGHCRLSATGGPAAGREWVSAGERLRVGSAPQGNDLVLEGDRAASRHHFELTRTERGWLLVDLGSTCGTWVDGERVERAYLARPVVIQAGGSTLAFAPVDEEVQVEPDPDGELLGMVGHSSRMRAIFGLIRKVAPLDVSVVIGGETGTGKELVARALHALSPRRAGPFVVLDCGAIPPELIESELFGHERGAFTGATASRPGVFERARGGTLFLDELGELRFDLQPKLLRALENREVRRVGSNDVVQVDCRVIAATHRDLAQEVAQGTFREDLYFRLSVITLQLPALRQRREDIPHIVKRALSEPDVLARYGKKRFSPEALGALMAYGWPGNVRELLNVLSHVLTFAEGDEVLPQHLPPRLQGAAGEAPVPFNEHLTFKDAKEQLLETFEREYLSTVLRRCEGNLSRAARESGLHRKSIERLVKKYALDAKGMRPR